MAKPRVIAIEEHYQDPEVKAHFKGIDASGGGPPHIIAKMEVGEARLRDMDEAGVDVQVLSHSAPSTQKMDAELSVRIAKTANDNLHGIVQTNPKRFAAFAALPTPDPKAAADELERTVTKLGFKGAMIHGLTNGQFIDDRKFWPIFERAQALDVPLYLHPSLPDETVIDRYYKDYVKEYPAILSAGWGFTVETATAGIRMVLSGAFKQYPNLKIILGHLGEGLPFLLWRLDHAFSRDGKLKFREAFEHHFWLTTSGNFSNPALICSVLELGIDRILFSIDYPFVNNKQGTDWIPHMPLSAEDKAKVLHGNAERLLKM